MAKFILLQDSNDNNRWTVDSNESYSEEKAKEILAQLEKITFD